MAAFEFVKRDAYGGLELLTLKEAQERYKGLVQEDLWLGLHNTLALENALHADDSITVRRFKLPKDHPAEAEWTDQLSPGSHKEYVSPIELKDDEYLRKFATQHAAFVVAGPGALLAGDAREYASQREITRCAAASLIVSLFGSVKDDFKRDAEESSRKLCVLIELDIPEPVSGHASALFVHTHIGWARTAEDAQPVQPEQVQPAAVEVV